MMFKKLLVMLFVAGSISTASAYDLSGKFGLGISGGYGIPVFGNPFNTAADADFSYGAHARYHFNSSFNLDLGVSRADFDKTDLRFDNINLLGVWRLGAADRFTPIVGAGAGLTRIKNFVPKSVKLAGLVRLGVEYGISQWFSLGVFGDYQYVSKLMGDMPNTKAHVVTPQLALTWYFGGDSSTREEAPATEPVKEEVKKEMKKEVVATPLVDQSKVDTDNDGINDLNDKCPNTAAGATVNSIGCEVGEKASMQINVEFASGKSTVATKYNDHLNEVADFLTKNPDINVHIEGYTDNLGSAAKNVALSEKRAKAVAAALVKRGIAKSRITSKGYGPENPIADNSTPEGRQANRRVIAVLSSK